MKNGLYFLLLLGLLISCKEQDKKGKQVSKTTRGNASLGADATLYPLVEELVNNFHYTFPDSKINMHYLPEYELVKNFLNDSLQTITLSRELNAQEIEILKSQQVEPVTMKIATDAIPLIL